MNGNIEKNSDASEGRMNKRSFLKKLDVGAAAAFGAPYVMGASKKSPFGGGCRPTRARLSVRM